VVEAGGVEEVGGVVEAPVVCVGVQAARKKQTATSFFMTKG
jgi:hypothetical protein